MIDPSTAEGYLPYVARMLAGDAVAFPPQAAALPRIVVAASGDEYHHPVAGEESRREEELIMVYSVKGVITKEDQDCGPSGTETLMRHMKRGDASDTVIAHMLEMDSGGGEATNIETVARFLRNEIRKPIIAWFNGRIGSAAYYMACACDEVYASEETDESGSIGALLSFADVRGMWEEKGVKFHEIYADQSSLKNLDFREALKGKYELLREGVINPYAQRFIDTVKEFRPQLSDPDAYMGKIYMTPDAIRIGMIDGQLTYQQAIARLAEMGRAHKQEQQSNSSSSLIQSSNMTYRRIQSTLGGPIETDRKGGVYLTADELALLEEGLAPAPAATLETTELPAVAALETRITAIETAVAGITASVAEMSASVDTLGQNVEALGKRPGAARTLAGTDGDDTPLISTDEADGLLAYEQKLHNAAANGQRVVVD